jgi:hypothetical protein
MNTMRTRVLAGVIITFCQAAYPKGFINLGFEAATIVRDPSGLYPAGVYASSAIPGWTPTSILGSKDILYNDVFLGATGVSIFDRSGSFPVINGAFSIQLYGGTGVTTGASISQTSLVPVDAVSILFKAQYGNGGNPVGALLVSLGGQNIPFSAISTGPNYSLYGGDVSAFAGQLEQLMFTAPPGVNNYWELDDIQFSPQSIPEPSVLGLSALGAFLLGWRLLGRRR